MDRRIELGRELEQDACLLAAALRHYEKKAKADEAVFARYVLAIATTLRATPLPAINLTVGRSLDQPARTRIEQWVDSLVEKSLQPFHDARMATQQAVDTPLELSRLAHACQRGS
jgi:hypothetical protein